ncbi:MAG: ECF-type riboflavin transporter substrate-binding protein [Erysipelotrichales bacterium]|nr:ECF-type riboflavin transporter substrate-binding protein [Erysipelotrichales bacterium]
MSKKKHSIGQLLLGKWDTKTIVGVAIGAALFGVLMNYGGIRVFTNTSLSTAMIVPVVVGALFGPLPACLAAFFGNVIADLIGGWGFWFDWSVGNGVAAFFVGLLPLYGAYITDGVFKTKHIVYYALCVVLGQLFAFGLVTPFLTYLWYSSDLTITFGQAWAASASNIAVQLVVGIPLLFVLANRYKRGTNLTKE